MTSEVSALAAADPWQRSRKAAWRQLVAAVRQALETALDQRPVDAPTVRFVSDEPALAREVSTRVRWRVVRGSAEPSAGRVHATVLIHHASPSAQSLIMAVTRAVELTRPGGVLILVADVVDGPTAPTVSMSQLLECVQHATGGCVHLDELRSLRWSNERLHRGVLLTMTLLGCMQQDSS